MNTNKLIALGLTILLSSPIIAQEETTEENSPLKLSGSIDMYFRSNITSPNSDSARTSAGTAAFAPASSFANHSGFGMGMANLIAEKEFGKTGFVADLVFGPRGDDAVFNGFGSDILVNQLYAYWNVNDKLTFTLGNFNTFLGYEVISPTGNFNYSTSYMFSYGPFSHTGLKADIALSDKLSFMAAIMNPTDYTASNYQGAFTYGAQLGYEVEKGGAWLNLVYGDQDGRVYNIPDSLTDGSDGALMQIDLTTGWNLTDKIYVGFNTTLNSVKNNVDSIDPRKFMGGALYLQYSLSEKVALGFRGEYFGEEMGGAGVYTWASGSNAANVADFTLSANIKQGNLTIIPELRYDMVTEDVFVDTEYKPTNNLASFVLAAVYKF